MSEQPDCRLCANRHGARRAPIASALRRGPSDFPDGRPIPEFDVSVLGFDGATAMMGGGGGLPSLGFGTGHDGTYAIETRNTYSHERPVDGIVVDVQARTTLLYNGRKYLMRLHPVDGLASWDESSEKGRNSSGGLARDFVLKIAGLKPGNDNLPPVLKERVLQDGRNYYGATLYLDDWDAGGNLRMRLPASARLVVRLVPEGPRMDGSPGRTLLREMPITALGTDAGALIDLPIGPYRVQASIVEGGVAKLLLLQITFGDPTWTNAVTVDFLPATDSSRTGIGEGLVTPTLKMKL